MDQKSSEGFDMEDEEVFFEHTASSPEDEEFDKIVGCLEEVVMDDAFQNNVITRFYQKHCGVFEEGKENKLQYTEIFTKFTELVESSLEETLSAKIQGFSMKKFEQLMASRQDELSGDVFDLLMSLGDFDEFKGNMLAQRQQQQQQQQQQRGGESKGDASGVGGGGMDLDLHVSGRHV